MVSLLASHLPGLPWKSLSTSALPLPMVSLLVSHGRPYHSLPTRSAMGDSFYLCPTIACLVYLCPTIACLVCHRLNTSPVYIPMVSLLGSHLPGLSWETVSFYLCPTTACLVCHRLNTSPVYIPMVSLLGSHLPGLSWETVSYLCPTTACLVCHPPT